MYLKEDTGLVLQKSQLDTGPPLPSPSLPPPWEQEGKTNDVSVFRGTPTLLQYSISTSSCTPLPLLVFHQYFPEYLLSIFQSISSVFISVFPQLSSQYLFG